ncbi:hypothetical protein DSM112329_03092 [Paraconexibacter sp. AEG42_29]|uniref:Prepilin-type N-terminal cleavage/methylation domain-containing protein n=1 Tax=Paraconexibacter sp. AEG42_29 TaxID=2997339 RepID=A0AAU7AY36_9ACTN
MTPPRPRRRDDDGLTLVELLIAMSLSTIVLLATFQSFDVFSSETTKQTRQTGANDTARATMDRVVDDLRGASTIRTAAANDLVYSVATATGSRSVRLCVTGTTLYQSSSTTTTTPGSACGVAGTGWTQGVVGTVPAAGTTGFTYDGAASSATPAAVKSVGITLNIDATSAKSVATSTLRASATVRRTAGQLPISDGDVKVDCNSTGPLLTLGAGLSGLNVASVTYASTGGVTLGTGVTGTPVQLTIPKAVTTILATITDTAGITTTIPKTVECN